ncbi:MAG TPA: ATP-binding protein [Hanamia sp.]|nr:ATP-binding protein [Hanamia sp.]
MKKTFFILLVSFLSFKDAIGQHNYRDSLKHELSQTKADSSKVDLLDNIGWSFVFLDEDSAANYGRKGLEIAKQINYKTGEANCLGLLSFSLSLNGNFIGALDFGFKNLSLSENLKDTILIATANSTLMTCYLEQDDYEQALKYGLQAELFSKSPKVHTGTRAIILGLLGSAYEKLNQPDSALYYGLKSYALTKEWSGIYLTLGNIYADKGMNAQALEYYRKGIPVAEKSAIYIDLVDIYNGMSKIFESTDQIDSSVYYAQKSIKQKGVQSYPEGELRAATHLAHIYNQRGMKDSTIKYLQLSIALREKLFSREKTREAQSYAFNEQIHQQELKQKIEQDQLQYRNRLNVYILLAGLLILLLVAGGLWRRNIYRKRSFVLLQKQKQEIDNQKSKVEQTLEELKNTQSQLIQSEKMASLGELTAGIAHEIQNPLNFVNNFSEVNTELIDEMKSELANGNNQQAIELADDIKENEQKINHHGKRAGDIVKGMLQHSRSSTGVKEPTDINALADEYLRLSYHGLRAKDKNFNAEMVTDFDESIGKINIIPQNIGRVLLNLYNNAFYACAERSHASTSSAGQTYEPTVSVTTKKSENNIIITVSDNGNGIPKNVVDKIFQPFFTTKPTGSGTGLGLSLSYDIIKAAGGEIKAETKEGEGSKFIIELLFKTI